METDELRPLTPSEKKRLKDWLKEVERIESGKKEITEEESYKLQCPAKMALALRGFQKKVIDPFRRWRGFVHFENRGYFRFFQKKELECTYLPIIRHYRAETKTHRWESNALTILLEGNQSERICGRGNVAIVQWDGLAVVAPEKGEVFGDKPLGAEAQCLLSPLKPNGLVAFHTKNQFMKNGKQRFLTGTNVSTLMVRAAHCLGAAAEVDPKTIPLAKRTLQNAGQRTLKELAGIIMEKYEEWNVEKLQSHSGLSYASDSLLDNLSPIWNDPDCGIKLIPEAVNGFQMSTCAISIEQNGAEIKNAWGTLIKG